MDTTIDSFFLLPPLRRRQPQSLLVGALTLALLFQTTHACSAYAPPRHLTGAASDIRSSFCLLTPELVEGPYYLHNKLIRSAISEGMPGIPFEFSVTVIDYATCEPLANVFVDIWHCDALGLYSGYAKGSLEQIGQPDRFNLGHEIPTDNSTYMRGTMVTNADGVATFKSIMPGWYEGRVTHIHTKIHVPYHKSWSDQLSAYEDSHVVHTGQFYFNDSFVTDVSKESPYNTGSAARTLLKDDEYYYTEIDLTEISLKGSQLSEGIVGKVTAVVYPDWEAAKPESVAAASLMATNSRETAAAVSSAGSSATSRWYILLAGAVGGIVIGAATVLSLLAYTGKLAVAERRFVKLTESEEAGIQMPAVRIGQGRAFTNEIEARSP